MDYFPASAGDEDALASVGQHRCVYSLLMSFLPPPDSCCSLHQRIALDDGRDCKTVNKLLPPRPRPHPTQTYELGILGVSFALWLLLTRPVSVGARLALTRWTYSSCLAVRSVCSFSERGKKKRAFKEETHTRCEGKGSASQLVVCQNIVQWFSASETLQTWQTGFDTRLEITIFLGRHLSE